MRPVPGAPKRPALRYFGGKWLLAPWIISFFPPHESYVEPCGGAASVLLQKPRCQLETYNDIDGCVVNFFRVLRDKPNKLIQKINLTPWARTEFEFCLVDDGDDVERARRFFVRSAFSMHGGTVPVASDWRRRHSGTSPAKEVRSLEHLKQISERLSLVQIENDSAQRIVSAYGLGDDTLVYFDPPYIQETRTRHDGYVVESTNAWHAEMASLLYRSKGFVVVSGYACALYTDLYEARDWRRFDKRVCANSGSRRTESLWLNPHTMAALDTPRQASMDLFYG